MKSYLEQLLGTINDYRKTGTFCDVVFEVQGMKFPCHRNVLSASMSYFNAMFTSDFMEKDEAKVKLENIDSQGFEYLLDYVYGGILPDDCDELLKILPVASFLSYDRLKDECIERLKKKLGVEKAIQVFLSASLTHWDNDMRNRSQCIVSQSIGKRSKYNLRDEVISNKKRRNIEGEIEFIIRVENKNAVVAKGTSPMLIYGWSRTNTNNGGKHCLSAFECNQTSVNSFEYKSIISSFYDKTHAGFSYFQTCKFNNSIYGFLQNPEYSDYFQSCEYSKNDFLGSPVYNERGFYHFTIKDNELVSNAVFPKQVSKLEWPDRSIPKEYPYPNRCGMDSLNDSVYITTECKDLYRYDPEYNQFCYVGQFKVKSPYIVTTRQNHSIYALGSLPHMYGDKCVVHRYDPRVKFSGSFSVHSVPKAEYQYEAGVNLADNIYISQEKQIHIFDLKTNKFREGQPMKEKRNQVSMTTYEGKVIVVGLGDSRMEIYDPVKDEWQYGPNLDMFDDKSFIVAVGY